LDRAEPFYGKQIVSDVKSLLNIVAIFVPLPCFWALYDQYGSRWVAQAKQMNGNFGHWQVTPDQMATMNPISVLLLVLLFEKVIYPFLKSRKIDYRPLRRMKFGMFFTAISFVVVGILQLFLISYDLSMAWQIIPYAILSLGEILVSISGLEFAYSQAPKSMKSVIMAIWLLTISIGNAFVALTANAKIMNQAFEFFFYAILMILFLFLFIFLVKNYKYVDVHGKKEVDDELQIEQQTLTEHSEEMM